MLYFHFFWQNKYIYSQSAKKKKNTHKKTTGPDKSVNFKKAINCILMKNQRLRANSLDPDENSLSADSSASTLFANSAFFVFGALRVQSFNL